MSSTPLDLPVLISQIPYVQKIAHAEKAKPEVQRLLFNPMLQEKLLEREGKVQQVEKKTETTPIDRDGHNHQEQHAASDRKKDTEEDESADAGSSNPSPWAGNIVNVKI